MSTPDKDKNKVDLTTPMNPLQEQGKKINVADTPITEDKPKVQINVGNDADANPYANKPIAKQQTTNEMPDYTDYENSKVRATEIRQDLEREGEERRQNNRRIMTAIGDGLSGLANIYFTSQGTPDLLKGAPSLTGKMQERYDKMRKDAETRRANYLKVVRESADQKVKDMYTRYKDDVAQRNKEKELSIKEERVKKDAMLAEAKAMYYTNKADTEGYLAMEKAIEAGNYDEFFRLKMKNLEADTKKKEADANKPSKSSSGGVSSKS